MSSPASTVASLVNVIVGFLPERYQKTARRIILGVAIGMGLLVGLFVVAQHIGPRADGPIVDPIATHNWKAEALPENAATAYAEAIAALTDPPMTDWRDLAELSKLPLPAEINDWIDENVAVLELLARAVAIDECKLAMERQGDVMRIPAIDELRTLARFCAVVARRAAESHDMDTLVACANLTTGMSDHLSRGHGVLGYLIGAAMRAAAIEFSLLPYEWPELSSDDRLSYGRRWERVLRPLDNFSATLDFERDEWCWSLAEAAGASGGKFVPRRRVFGEVDRMMAPTYALASEPVEATLNMDNPHRAKSAQLRSLPAFFPSLLLNFARLGCMGISSYEQCFDLRGRVEAMVRAGRTVRALFDAHARFGRFPSGLEAISGADKVDPFTGQPFHYKRVGDGFLLYSAGVDGDDDDGRHHLRFGAPGKSVRGAEPIAPDGDYVFWPLQHAAGETP